MDFWQQVPKADLHVHLDGSLRLSSLIEFAQADNIKLPSYTEEGLLELVFKETYSSLNEYLQGFEYTCRVLQNPENLERTAYEFMLDCFEQGILYVEVRYCPDLFTSLKFIEDQYILIQSIEKGFKRAQEEINTLLLNTLSLPSWLKNTESLSSDYSFFTDLLQKGFKYKHIICDLRHFELSRSEFIFDAALKAYENGMNIAALDSAGPEVNYSCSQRQDLFAMDKYKCFKRTIHAGEADGLFNIRDAINLLGATRIGHGFHFYDYEFGSQPLRQQDRDELIALVKDQQIYFEVCPSSNLQTIPALKGDMKNHSLLRMLDYEIPFCINTDNTLVSRTDLNKELGILQNTYGLSNSEILNIIRNGFKAAF